MKQSKKSILMKPIGTVHTEVEKVPRHWTVSDVEGTLTIHEKYLDGLKDIRAGQRLLVIFHFHKSPEFKPEFLIQNPPHHKGPLGVFSIYSPIRPNPIGLSIVQVLDIRGNVIHVKGIDMLDGTPILDIKPFVEDREDCPGYEGPRRATTP